MVWRTLRPWLPRDGQRSGHHTPLEAVLRQPPQVLHGEDDLLLDAQNLGVPSPLLIDEVSNVGAVPIQRNPHSTTMQAADHMLG
ncbi:hypothetical protein NHX12_031021 [Muraenolepis orangiensis]|uniref:Uncharacterized protein n=1 Tax=Muraenolepis orangiensis TaxID=630683 RepID=A0A9Q0ILR7_9TELE|nr:hypothetical protein NHX12_031021 [Muraenolepis orangiensis]